MRIALLGYGKMGKTIEKLASEKGHIIIYKGRSNTSEGVLSDAEVAIEFSSPESAADHILQCLEASVPVVSGTTGWLGRYPEIVKKCNACNGSFLYASNFSIGVNLFFNINEYTAKLMAPWKAYVPSLKEVHHIQKKDAPSGTAITLAEGIIKHSEKEHWSMEQASERTIRITAEREGEVKGIHEVTYASETDTITLKHDAHTRDGFALGAILAAEWLQHKKGVYTMKDVLQIE